MLENIANQFKRPSGFVGNLVSNLMIRGNMPAYRNLIKELDVKKSDKILEIGYGPGAGINHISKNFEFEKLFGIDFSELMFNKATAKNYNYIVQKKVRLLYGDFLITDIGTKDFDKIFCLNVVYFWDDVTIPFKKINSLLNNSGEFIFYMSSKEDLDRIKFTKEEVFNKYSIEFIEQSLKDCGFSHVEYFYEKGYFIKAKK